jgi:hypothetical protein
VSNFDADLNPFYFRLGTRDVVDGCGGYVVG